MSEHRLAETVIERPRGGGRVKTAPGSKKRLQQFYDEGRQYESLRRSWQESGHTKWFSDCLGPLHRWLRSKVGQPWDRVYSELCQKGLKPNTLSGQHIFSHVWAYVERDVLFVAGVPYRKQTYKHEQSRPLGFWREQLYVHPETGVLCVAPKVYRKPSRHRDDRIVLDASCQYQKLEGQWYLVTLADLPSGVPVFDVVLRGVTNASVAYAQYGRSVYATSKRQCSKKEIKFILKKLAQKPT